jgi:hypothetical protein
MPDPLTIRDLIEAKCLADGYDGLFNDAGECSCTLEELAPCGCLNEECAFGVKKMGCTCGEGCDFHIVPPGEPDDDTTEEE